MISKQNLWFLTLFSLILVLSVYYITMPNDVVLKNTEASLKKKENKPKITVKKTNELEAMRVSLEEEREELTSSLKEQLTNKELSPDEKNNAYEKIKYLNGLQGKEENLEKKIKNNLKIDSFVKIDNSNISVVAISNNHDKVLANNIMRTIQEEYKDRVFTTVKFQNGHKN